MDEGDKQYTHDQEAIIEEGDAKVYEARYRTIEKTIKPPLARRSAITMYKFEIKRGLRGTWPKVPLILAGFIVFGFLVGMDDYLETEADVFWKGAREQGILGIQGSISTMMTPMDGPGAIMIIHIAVISAGLIAGDLKDRAIDLYFSKITVKSYFISKIIASMVLTFIGMPLFVIIFYLIALYKRLPLIENFNNEISVMGEIAWQAGLTLLIITLFLSILILVFSAYTTNPVNAGVSFVVFTLVSRVFFESILYEATNIDLFYALSPISALDVIRRAILEPDEISDQFLELSILTYLLYIIISIFTIWIKLYKEKNQ